jgi:hypothetical protein
MPKSELNDFINYWDSSMRTVIGGQLSNRPPGGSGIAVGGISGVDYNSTLIPWCKGNSVSVDQRTLDPYRQVFQVLIGKAHNRLTLIDQGKLNDARINSGLNYEDLEKLYDKARAKGSRRVAGGKFDKNWKKAETLFINLLQNNHIQLYENNDTHAKVIQGEILKQLNLGIHEKNWDKEDENEWMLHGICCFMRKYCNKGGHIRINEAFGWETYIRDRWGAPGGIPGTIAGNLTKKYVGIPTMNIPLHYVLAETLACAMMGGRGEKEWGTNQSKIRRDMADKALDHPLNNRINLNDYYMIFSKHSAAHMADSYFLRHIDDKTSARYELIEITGSNPKQWDVQFEPEFLRWRTNQRNRTRKTGGVP